MSFDLVRFCCLGVIRLSSTLSGLCCCCCCCCCRKPIHNTSKHSVSFWEQSFLFYGDSHFCSASVWLGRCCSVILLCVSSIVIHLCSYGLSMFHPFYSFACIRHFALFQIYILSARRWTRTANIHWTLYDICNISHFSIALLGSNQSADFRLLFTIEGRAIVICLFKLFCLTLKSPSKIQNG